MSDVTFRPVLSHAPAHTSTLALLRTYVRRGRSVAASVAETIHTYSLIEGACLFAAVTFGSVMIGAAIYGGQF